MAQLPAWGRADHRTNSSLDLAASTAGLAALHCGSRVAGMYGPFLYALGFFLIALLSEYRYIPTYISAWEAALWLVAIIAGLLLLFRFDLYLKHTPANYVGLTYS